MDVGTITNPLAVSLAVSLAINLSMFLVAFRLKSDKLTDISYAVTFAVIALWAFVQSSQSAYHVLLLAMIALWAARLGGFLLYRVVKRGKDARFDGIRENFARFGKFWLAQALTVWVLLIPSVLAFDAPAVAGSVLLIGLIVWGAGLAFETIADTQKLQFGRDPKNKNKWIDSGLWKYSRHPNYFGEILVWVGVYLYAIASLPLAQAAIGLLSPLFIVTLLVFVSGIPILEKSADKRWGKQKAYNDYKKRTSILIPLPRKK